MWEPRPNPEAGAATTDLNGTLTATTADNAVGNDVAITTGSGNPVLTANTGASMSP